MKRSISSKPKAYNTFRNKILLAFIICSLVPLALLGFFSYNRSLTIAKDSIYRSAMYTSRQVGQLISARMSQMTQVADATQYLLYQLNTTADHPFTGFLDKYVEIRNNISSLVTASRLYSVNVFVNGEGILTQDGIMFSPIKNSEIYGFTEADLLRKIDGNRRNWTVLYDVPVLRVPIQPGKRETLISCYWGKFNMTRDRLDYVYFVNLQVSEMTRLLQGNLEDGINRFLIDDAGVVIASSGAEDIPADIREAISLSSAVHEETSLPYSGGSLFEYLISANNWRLITTIDDAYIRSKTRALVNIYILTILFIFAALVIAIAILSSNLTRKIDLLASAMRTYKISKENTALTEILKFVRRPAEKRDELDEITVDFVEMAERLEANYQELLNAKLEEEKLNYRLLQAKINPHFLYNILDSIKTCQSFGNIDTANLIITKLARFYRKQLNSSTDLIPLASELESVSEYLEIENHCRTGRIRLKIEMEDGLGGCMIPPFTVQPVVENCVQHGLRGSGCELNIIIRVSYDEDFICIAISDDGVGIPDAELWKVRRDLADRSVVTTTHFGLKSLSARLSLINSGGSDFHPVSVESESGIGTTVTIRIEPVLSDSEGEFEVWK